MYSSKMRRITLFNTRSVFICFCLIFNKVRTEKGICEKGILYTDYSYDFHVCFWILSTLQNFTQSLNLCSEDHGTLAIIPDDNVLQFLNQFRSTIGKENDAFYIGFNLNNQSELTYLNGEVQTWTPWDLTSGQPGPEQCVSTYQVDGKFRTENCSSELFAICQWPEYEIDEIECMMYNNNTCYWLTETSQTFNESRNICSKYDGNLALIPDEDVLTFLANLRADHGMEFEEFYIGYRVNSHGELLRLDGKVQSWAPWESASNEPSVTGCVTTFNPEGYFWSNLCSEIYRAVCQFTSYITTDETGENPCAMYNDTCFWLTTTSQSFSESRNICEHHDGSLAVTPDVPTLNFITELRVNESMENDKFYVGYHVNAGQDLLLLDGQIQTWAPWETGEPNQVACVTTFIHGYFMSEKCLNSYHAVCQWPSYFKNRMSTSTEYTTLPSTKLLTDVTTVHQPLASTQYTSVDTTVDKSLTSNDFSTYSTKAHTTIISTEYLTNSSTGQDTSSSTEFPISSTTSLNMFTPTQYLTGSFTGQDTSLSIEYQNYSKTTQNILTSSEYITDSSIGQDTPSITQFSISPTSQNTLISTEYLSESSTGQETSSSTEYPISSSSGQNKLQFTTYLTDSSTGQGTLSSTGFKIHSSSYQDTPTTEFSHTSLETKSHTGIESTSAVAHNNVFFTTSTKTSTSVHNLYTSSPSCSCVCTQSKQQHSHNLTDQEKEEIVANITKELSIDKKSLSSTIRSKTSAKDNRPSATSIGSFGVIILVMVCGGTILMDAPYFLGIIKSRFDHLRKWCRFSKTRESNMCI